MEHLHCHQDDETDYSKDRADAEERTDFQDSCLRVGDGRSLQVAGYNFLGVLLSSLRGYTAGMEHSDYGLRGPMEAEGNNSSEGRSESHWDGRWRAQGYYNPDCKYR
jgi:hypothetical protein